MRNLIDWWLELGRPSRFALSGGLLAFALVQYLAFDTIWFSAWAAGGVLFVLTALGVGEDRPL